MTPRTWPEGQTPTPEQVARWLKRCTRTEREEAARHMLNVMEWSRECLMHDHVGRIDQLRVGRMPVWWTPTGLVG